MTREQAEKFLKRISVTTSTVVPLTDKETEILGKLLTSEVMSKALCMVNAYARTLPDSLLSLNLEDPTQRMQATRTQGLVQGIMHAVELLFGLVISEDDEHPNQEIE